MVAPLTENYRRLPALIAALVLAVLALSSESRASQSRAKSPPPAATADPPSAAVQIRYYRGCAFWYLSGWQTCYNDFHYHLLTGNHLSDELPLPLPFICGPFAWNGYRQTGQEHCTAALQLACNVVGREQVPLAVDFASKRTASAITAAKNLLDTAQRHLQ